MFYFFKTVLFTTLFPSAGSLLWLFCNCQSTVYWHLIQSLKTAQFTYYFKNVSAGLSQYLQKQSDTGIF